jgi:hypothetical protein
MIMVPALIILHDHAPPPGPPTACTDLGLPTVLQARTTSKIGRAGPGAGTVSAVADLYELVLGLDLRDLTPDEEAELRWHVGAAGRPERLVLGTDRSLPTWPLGDPADPDCEWETAEPEPAFANTGPAYRIGGLRMAAMETRDNGWALTVRQELHPDDFPALRAILERLGPRAVHDGFVGHLRFYESDAVMPLIVHDGRIALPDDVLT